LKRETSQAKANLVENENQEFVAMVIGLKGLQIVMVTKVHMATTNSIGWFIDSGASMHICNDKAQFKRYEEVIDKKVLMENHSVAKVLGQATVELQFTSEKKLTLKHVLHVPEIRKNLISAFLLYKNGFKSVLESYHIVLSKNGILTPMMACLNSILMELMK